MTDRTQLDVAMKSSKGPIACPRCKREHPAFAMSCVLANGKVTDILCTECVIDQTRIDNLRAERRELRDKFANSPWETPQGVEMRMERNRRIESARWAVDPITSPLSTDCQAAFVDYIRALNRLTLDFDSPAAVIWPTAPELVYPS